MILDAHSSSLSGLVTFLGKVNGVQSEAGKFSHYTTLFCNQLYVFRNFQIYARIGVLSSYYQKRYLFQCK